MTNYKEHRHTCHKYHQLSPMVHIRVPTYYGKLSVSTKPCYHRGTLHKVLDDIPSFLRKEFGCTKLTINLYELCPNQKGAGRAFEIWTWSDRHGKQYFDYFSTRRVYIKEAQV